MNNQRRSVWLYPVFQIPLICLTVFLVLALLFWLFGCQFNQNYRLLILWLGAAWIALMWVLVLPLDRWILQDLFKMHWNTAGKIALSHALFWSALTPLIVWQLWRLFGIPGLTAC
jgi:Ca-activated chloride channel family protein